MTSTTTTELTEAERLAALEEIVANLILDVGHVSMNGRASKRPATVDLIERTGAGQ